MDIKDFSELIDYIDVEIIDNRVTCSIKGDNKLLYIRNNEKIMSYKEYSDSLLDFSDMTLDKVEEIYNLIIDSFNTTLKMTDISKLKKYRAVGKLIEFVFKNYKCITLISNTLIVINLKSIDYLFNSGLIINIADKKINMAYGALFILFSLISWNVLNYLTTKNRVIFEILAKSRVYLDNINKSCNNIIR